MSFQTQIIFQGRHFGEISKSNFRKWRLLLNDELWSETQTHFLHWIWQYLHFRSTRKKMAFHFQSTISFFVISVLKHSQVWMLLIYDPKNARVNQCKNVTYLRSDLLIILVFQNHSTKGQKIFTTASSSFVIKPL